TSFYSWRLMFMTFYGSERGDHHAHEHAHESPWVMTVPLGALALGAIFAGMLWYKPFFGDHDRMTAFFAMPHHAEAGAEAASGTEAPAEGGATAMAEGTAGHAEPAAGEESAETHADAGHTAVGA